MISEDLRFVGKLSTSLLLNLIINVRYVSNLQKIHPHNEFGHSALVFSL